MARELVNITNQNEEIMEKIEELPLLKKQYEVNQFHDFFFIDSLRSHNFQIFSEVFKTPLFTVFT